jgi:PAS domain S-box-containing protein
VSSSPRETGRLLDLVSRIHHSPDRAAGFFLLLEDLLAPRGVERGLAVVEREGELEVVEGVGWERGRMRSLSICGQLASGVARALDQMEVGVEEQDPPLLEGLERYVILPLPGADDPSRGFAAVVAPSAGWDGERWEEETAEARRHLGPALHRLEELHALRISSRQLDRQRDLLTSIVNALPDPVLITDADNNLVLENGRAEALFTSTESDSGGRRRAVEINNLLFSSFLSRAGLGPEEAQSRELNLVDPSEGGDLLFEVLATSLPESVIGNGATVSVLRDVTDLKRAATELEHQFKRVRQAELRSRRERDRLNLILENVGDPILVTDAQANIILMNREAERLFDVPARADVKPAWRRTVRANDTKFTSMMSEFALSPDQARAVELDLEDPETGGSFPVEVVSGKILNERSEMSAIVSIVHDLTKVVENERLAEELVHLNEGLEDRVRSATEELAERNRQLEWQSQELERAYRLKSEFLASMSHELRTPINALLGYTSLMRDRIYGDLTDRQEESLQRMYSASQHLLELVNDILDLAKIEAGKMPVHVERVDLSSLIRELSQTIEPMVRAKELEYVIDIEEGLPTLDTDRTKVKQVILNLLSNAVKFTNQGEIRISARHHPGDEEVEIAISDTGIGIEKSDQDKIFEDFRQADQSSTREYGGTGLGLSITTKLLKLLGGTIRLESELGKGSTFHVRLPLSSEEILLNEEAARVARQSGDAVVTSADAGERKAAAS